MALRGTRRPVAVAMTFGLSLSVAIRCSRKERPRRFGSALCLARCMLGLFASERYGSLNGQYVFGCLARRSSGSALQRVSTEPGLARPRLETAELVCETSGEGRLALRPFLLLAQGWHTWVKSPHKRVISHRALCVGFCVLVRKLALGNRCF